MTYLVIEVIFAPSWHLLRLDRLAELMMFSITAQTCRYTRCLLTFMAPRCHFCARWSSKSSMFKKSA